MITEFIIKWIAGVVALAIFFLPVVIPVVLIFWLTKRKKNKDIKGKSGSDTGAYLAPPEWEKVLLEDGTEFWRLKGSALPLYRVLMSNGYYEKQIEVILTELGICGRKSC